jgi:hypothetical protein
MTPDLEVRGWPDRRPYIENPAKYRIKLKAEYPVWDANPATLATFEALAKLDINTNGIKGVERE